MFNIGGGELVVIALIALIVLGPQRLPGAARQLGKTMGELRRLSSGFQQEMKNALDDTERPASPRRNVLGASDDTASNDDSVTAAVRAVSSQGKVAPKPAAKARRQPLRAAPAAEEDAPPAARRRSNS